ncbi:hypothetical protein OIO90_000555 [Microbotryomycetes sp. JL221]|nr:hypothetical protein OIO90_000555 [Microbotryomycetes sp. JL221]
MVLTNRTCEAINDLGIDPEPFWNGNWEPHKIGWLVAGVTALITTMLSMFTVMMHARNYYVPKEQRQIIRIVLMPLVYAIVSFFGYRFYKQYTYFSLIEVVYEALVLAAFLWLLLHYIGESSHAQRQVLLQKEKRAIPGPFCCIRFRASKPYFLHALRWSVLQYSLLRPLISVAGIITNAFGLYCPTGYSIYFSAVYLDSIDFVSISIALYGLITFYALTKELLNGKRPLAKFLAIKLIVAIVFYQGFMFSVLADHGVLKETEYWTKENIANGLDCLCVCCEMVIFAIVFMFAFTWKPYAELKSTETTSRTSAWRAILHALNFSDFIVEGGRGIVFTWHYIRGQPGTSTKRDRRNPGLDIDAAMFGDVGGFTKLDKQMFDQDLVMQNVVDQVENSSDEGISLTTTRDESGNVVESHSTLIQMTETGHWRRDGDEGKAGFTRQGDHVNVDNPSSSTSVDMSDRSDLTRQRF